MTVHDGLFGGDEVEAGGVLRWRGRRAGKGEVRHAVVQFGRESPAVKPRRAAGLLGPNPTANPTGVEVRRATGQR